MITLFFCIAKFFGFTDMSFWMLCATIILDFIIIGRIEDSIKIIQKHNFDKETKK